MNMRDEGHDGTVDSSPMSSLPHPHWNTMTSTPYAAPMLSRLSSAALIGTKTERNTSISSSTESTTTAATNQTRRC